MLQIRQLDYSSLLSEFKELKSCEVKPDNDFVRLEEMLKADSIDDIDITLDELLDIYEKLPVLAKSFSGSDIDSLMDNIRGLRPVTGVKKRRLL